MSHLSPGTFVDLLDGSLAEESLPHLKACQACRQQLAELRATWEAAQGFEAPEPSPLFWDHFSARVHEAVSTEPLPTRGWRPFAHWRMALLAAGAAAVLVAAALGPLRTDTVSSGTVAPEAAAALVDQAPVAEPLPEDDSLGFVADLASNINWDNSADSVLTHGDADRVLADMDAGERAELRRLLDEALGNRKI
jgi:hypothetical protein